MIQFFYYLPIVCIVDCIGCGSEYTELSWIGLDWVIKLLDWVGLDLAKWTHVQLCVDHLPITCTFFSTQTKAQTAVSIVHSACTCDRMFRVI